MIRQITTFIQCIIYILGIGDGDWGLGPIPNPQSPIPNPQSPIPNPQYIINGNSYYKS